MTIRNNKRQRLVLNTDYTVQYKNNKKIGIATIIITGKGAYTGSTSYEFNITKKKVVGNKIGETDDGDDSWKSERAEDRKKREEAYKKAQQAKKYAYYQYKKKAEEKKKADEKKKAADKKKEEKKKKAEEKKKAQTNQNWWSRVSISFLYDKSIGFIGIDWFKKYWNNKRFLIYI